MRELCACSFRNTELVKVTKRRAECTLERLSGLLESARHESSDRILVASRNRSASLYMDLELFRANPDLSVIWMLRSPLDILTSVHKSKSGFYVQPYRLIASLNLFRMFQNEPRVLAVRYEDLVSRPEQIQNEIAAKFSLESVRNFSESHEHFPRFKQNIHALHSIRPIDSDSVDKWKSNRKYSKYLLETLKAYPELIAQARGCGYDISVEAITSANQSAGQEGGGLSGLRDWFSKLRSGGSEAGGELHEQD